MAICHLLDETPVKFESCASLGNIGLLFLIPFLIEAGLLTYRNHYKELSPGYYYIDFIIMQLAYMFLARIKNPESLKNVSPGEFGKLHGLDRVPEVRCFRSKLKQITNQNHAGEWNAELAKKWSGEEENEFYYIDGHVQVYNGSAATLGKKHIARQRLCLPGMQDFWVNNGSGLPYFYVTGQVNEKLMQMIKEEIVPQLIEDIHHDKLTPELFSEKDKPLFTIVFDREGYSPVFFETLWNEYRVAVLTYRKNVKDKWTETEFSEYTIETESETEKIMLAEKMTVLNGVELREIRKLSDDGHQTSIVTTNKKLRIEEAAVTMFNRWSQENYFRYMRREYNLDSITQYVVEQIDGEFAVSNPEYNNVTYKIKKIREKIGRRKARLLDLIEKNLNEPLEQTGKQMKHQLREREEISNLEQELAELLKLRSTIPSIIKIKDMSDLTRYTKLQTEIRHFENTVKMICYRAETYCVNLLSEFYKRHDDEKRNLVRSIIHSNGDLIVDDKNQTIRICIYSLSTNRMNVALNELCDLLNAGEYKHPTTNYHLIYEIAK